MVTLFLANGFEEVEALTVVDVLRRAEIAVKMVSIDEDTVTGAHGIKVVSDARFSEASLIPSRLLVLPGGMPGTSRLKAHEGLMAYVKEQSDSGTLIGAICAAPSLLDALGLLKNRHYTCSPGFESQDSTSVYRDEGVVVDGNIITAKGVGASMSFALELVKQLKGADIADALKQKMVFTHRLD